MRRAALVPLAILLCSCQGHAPDSAAKQPSPRELDFTGRATTITPAEARRVTSLRLTSRMPRGVQATCRAARLFRCPHLIPAGGLSRFPYTHGPADTGRGIHVISFNNGTIRGHTHWIVGGGTPKALSRSLIDDRYHEGRGLPKRIRLLQLGGTRIAVYAWRGNAGGYLTGHTAAFAETGRRVIFASVHGHTHADADIAMVADMIGP